MTESVYATWKYSKEVELDGVLYDIDASGSCDCDIFTDYDDGYKSCEEISEISDVRINEISCGLYNKETDEWEDCDSDVVEDFILETVQDGDVEFEF